MSIADKLTYLNETKSLLREAINAAGGNLTQETPFREYAEGWLRDQSASLILDFSKQQYVAKDKVSMFPDSVGFEDIVTFTRPTGGGRFNAQGDYEWVGSDEPRIDYDPLTGECLGLLVEEQRTNLVLRSNDLTSSDWDRLRVIAEPAPNSYHKLIATDGASTNSRIRQKGELSEDQTYTYSIEMKAGEFLGGYIAFETGAFGNCYVNVNLQTKKVVAVGADVVDYKFKPTQDGIFLSVTGFASTISNTPPSVGMMALGTETDLRPSVVGDGMSGIYVRYPQLEVGSFPTSYIPTEDSQVTRAADTVTRELGDEFNPSEGTFVISLAERTGNDGHLLSMDQPLFQLSLSGASQRLFYSIAGQVGSVAGTETTKRFAVSFLVGGVVSIAADGEIVGSFAYLDAPASYETLYLGGRGSEILRQTKLSEMRYFPRALTEAELIELTK